MLKRFKMPSLKDKLENGAEVMGRAKKAKPETKKKRSKPKKSIKTKKEKVKRKKKQ